MVFVIVFLISFIFTLYQNFETNRNLIVYLSSYTNKISTKINFCFETFSVFVSVYFVSVCY